MFQTQKGLEYYKILIYIYQVQYLLFITDLFLLFAVNPLSS